MISSILKKFLSNKPGNSGVDLDSINTDEKVKIATCVIILECVSADDHISKEERNSIVEILMDRFDLSRKESEKLIQLSKKHRNDHPGIWYFTNIINEHLNKESKYDLLEMDWRAIYTDGNLDKYERSVSNKLRGLLHIEHSKFINIKLKVQNDIT